MFMMAVAGAAISALTLYFAHSINTAPTTIVRPISPEKGVVMSYTNTSTSPVVNIIRINRPISQPSSPSPGPGQIICSVVSDNTCTVTLRPFR